MDDKATILLNYDKMEAVSTKLTEIANRINGMNEREFEMLYESLLEGWKGETAVLFEDKTVEWKTRMNSIEKQISEISQSITASANAYKEAELKALALMEEKQKQAITDGKTGEGKQ